VVNEDKLLIYGEEIPKLKYICSDFFVQEGRQLVDEFCSKAAAAGIQLPDIGLMILCGGGSLLQCHWSMEKRQYSKDFLLPGVSSIRIRKVTNMLNQKCYLNKTSGLG